MRFDPPLPIAAVTSWLPPGRDTVADAVAAGRLDAETAAAEGYTSTSVSADLAAPELAVLAATDALATAGWDPATVDLVVHAWTYHQGHDFWSPPHFVADRIGARCAIPVGVQQMCNGGAAAIEVAASRLLADPAVTRAVVTTGDRFVAPGFDRWLGDYGAAYGDAGTALLLGGTGTATGTATGAAAPLRLLATVTVAASDLEIMHRSGDPFSPVARATRWQVNSRFNVRHFFDSGGRPRLDEHATAAMHDVLAAALAAAGLTGDDPRLRAVAVPRLGRTVLDTAYLPALARHTTAPVVELGRDTGHLGAGDPIANLADLSERGLDPGDIVILLSVGAGFTWSAIVVDAAPPR